MGRDLTYEQELAHKQRIEQDKQNKRARLRYTRKIETICLKKDKGVKFIQYNLKDPQL